MNFALRALGGVLLLAGSLPALEVNVVGVTPTQAILSYTAPDNSDCTVRITEEGSATPVPDVDPALFPGSQTDARQASLNSGRFRVFVAGKRTAERAANGRLYSRALQAYTPHKYTVTCGADKASGAFTTANIPLGSTYPELPGFDPTAFANQDWPSMDWANKNVSYIDPLSGIRIRRITGPGEALPMRFNNRKFAASLDPGSGWTDPGNATSASQTSLASTTKTSPLFLPLDVLTLDYSVNTSYLPGMGVDDLLERAWGFGSDPKPENRSFELCLSTDSGQTCATNNIRLTAGLSAAPVPTDGAFPAAPFQRWGGMTIDRSLMAQPTGKVRVTGSQATLISGSSFNPDWKPGSRIFIEGSAPACADSHCTIAAVRSGSALDIQESLELNEASYRAANFGLRVKKTTSTGTLSVSFGYDLAASRMFTMPTNGSNDLCSKVPDKTTVDEAGNPLSSPQTGYLCTFPNTSGFSTLFFFIPETGEARLLSGLVKSWSSPNPDDAFGGYVQVRMTSFDPQDPRSVYGTAITGDKKAFVLVRGRYTGDYRTWNPNYAQAPVPPDRMEWTIVTPASKGMDVATQLKAAKPLYDPGLFPYLSGIGVFAGKYVVQASASQDLPCLIGFFDLNTGQLTKAVDSWSEYPGRWGVCHTIQPIGHGTDMLAAINAARAKSPSAPLAGPFYVPLTQVFKNGSWSNDTSLNESYAEACPSDLDARWTALGAVGNQCVRFRISGEPCSDTPTALEKSKFPCPWDSNKSMLQTLEEGDIMTDFSVNSLSERLRVVRKTVHSPDNIELVLQRKVICQEKLPASYYQHPNGWRPSMSQPGGCHGAGWWVDVTGKDPGWRLEVPSVTASHNDIGTGKEPGTSTVVIGAYRVRTNRSSADFGQEPSVVLNGTPLFARSGAAMKAQYLQSYPSMRQWNAPAMEKNWAMDFRAYQAGLGVGAETALALHPLTVTPVAGVPNVYQVKTTVSGYDRKRTPFLAWAGKRWLSDMSGPGSVIGASDTFRFCVADRPGECRPGSAQNDTFLNVPSATLTGQCTTNQYLLNIPCFGSAQSVGAWVVQWDISRPPGTGLLYRRLSMAFSGPGRQYTFANARPDPDGKWVIMPGYWLDGYRMDLLAAKLPPWPGRTSEDRSDFVSVTRRIQGVAGAPNIRVRFGYAENGEPESFYCTARREACLAGPGASPYWFESEAPASGVPCRDGCEITIPAIPGRVVYYRVERLREDGSVEATEPVAAVASS